MMTYVANEACNLTPIKKVAKKIIIACAAGGRGDPCTQCESEKRKVARGALLCSQGR